MLFARFELLRLDEPNRRWHGQQSRGVFLPGCAAHRRLGPKINTTLGGVSPVTGIYDSYTVTPNSQFCYGYNDWGLGNATSLASPEAALGLGGDVDGGFYHGKMQDSAVVAPAQMIMLAETRAIAISAGGQWEANIDPTDMPDSSQGGDGGQEPSNRHNYKTDILCCDGHSEQVLRNDKGPGNPNPMNLIDPTPSNPWRARWCNDNQVHNELTWPTVASTAANPTTSMYLLDPSY